LIQREANLTLQDTQLRTDSEKFEAERGKVVLADESREAIENIKALSADMTNSALTLIQSMTPPEKPKTTPRIKAQRINGELVSVIDDVDEAGNVVKSRKGRVSRKGGDIVAAIEQLGEDGQPMVRESRFRSTPEGIVSVS
jgi:hypothetical protein